MSQPLGDEAQRLLKQALALPADERQALVAELVASLPEERDVPEDPALLEELAQRFARYESGDTRARSWAEVRAEVEARLQQLRKAG